MKHLKPPRNGRTDGLPSRGLILAMVLAMTILVLLGMLFKRSDDKSAESKNLTAASSGRAPDESQSGRPPSFSNRSTVDRQPSAEEIVADKVIGFSKIRRKYVYALAKRRNVPVPDDVKRFFDAVASGRWEEINAAHEALLLSKDQLNQPRSAELHEIWRPIQETWGAAREAHDWPAQRLLTQNALSDNTYLNYLNFLYGDQISTLTQDDSQQAFQAYVADAQKRLEHDQQFPNEPRQIKPGEDVKLVDGKVQVSGQIAVMAINEKLFQALMAKNPNMSFAMEESFPFSSLYQNARPLGPVIEMGFPDESNPLTADLAAQSVDYWRTAADQLINDPAVADGSDPRKAYSKLISSQAGILADHQFTAEAEQEFRIAAEICPASPEVTFRYVSLLMGQNRMRDALQVAENALKADPENQQFVSLRNTLNTKNKAGR